MTAIACPNLDDYLAPAWQAERLRLYEANTGMAFKTLHALWGRSEALRRHFGHSVEDAAQEVRMCLWRLTEKFDPWRHCTFGTLVGTSVERYLWSCAGKEATAKRSGVTLRLGDVEPAVEDDVEDALESHEFVARLLGILDDREREAVQRSLGIGREPESLKRIGRRLGVSPERIRQIIACALGRMRGEVEG